MAESFVGVRAKLDRAERHLNVAAKVIRHFVRNECGASPEQDVERGLTNVVIRLPKPPAIISLLAGDSIHNMRSALDHIVYEVIRRNPDRPSGTPNDKTQFPICDTFPRFDRQVEMGRLQGAPTEAIERIRELQPYHRRDANPDHTLHILWILNKLENIDKHRRLALTSGVGFQSRVQITDSAGGETTVLAHETLHDGAIVANYHTPRPGQPSIHVQGDVSAFVGLDEPDELPSLIDVNIGNILIDTLRYIRQKIVPSFDKFA